VDPWSEEQRQALEEISRRLDARAAAATEGRAWWPCRKGCDHCCRHLADPLPVTRLEWAVLWEGFLRLPAEAQAEIRARVAELQRSGAGRPYTCPFLDREAGACRVYSHRPMACRSYGFAVSRGQGLWCHFILEQLKEHGEGDIVWSNQDALEETLARLAGPPVTFFEWFAAHPE
jgi:Fe-S-cluster containining protein